MQEFFGYFIKYYIEQSFGWNYIVTMVILSVQVTIVMNSYHWNLKGIFVKLADLLITFFLQIFFFCFWEYFLGSHVYINYIVWPFVILVHCFYFCHYQFFDRLSKGVFLMTALYLEPMLTTSIIELMAVDNRYFDALSCTINMIFAIFISLFSSKFTLKKTDKINYMCFFLLIFLVAFVLAFITTDLPEGTAFQNAWSHISIYGLILSVAIISYYFFYRINVEYSRSLENQAIILKAEKTKNALEQSQANLEDLRKRRHDMKNQYQYMRLLLEQGNTEKLRDFFEKMIKGSDVSLNKGGDYPLVSAWEKEEAIKHNGVTLFFHKNIDKIGEKSFETFKDIFSYIIEENVTKQLSSLEMWIENNGNHWLFTLALPTENKPIDFSRYPSFCIQENEQKTKRKTILKTYSITENFSL